MKSLALKTSVRPVERVALDPVENGIMAVSAMTAILADLLENMVMEGSRNAEGFSVKLTNDELNTMAFAWNDLRTRAENLQESFYKL